MTSYRRFHLLLLLVTVTVTLGLPAIASATVTKTAVTPVSATATVAFHGTVATFTSGDAGPFTATVIWGDGTTSQAQVIPSDKGSYAVTGSHTYGHEGSYFVAVTVTDTSDASQGAAKGTATVADAPLTVTAAALTARTGRSFSGTVGHLGDPDPSGGTYSATVDWGDGASSSATVSPDPSGGQRLDAMHTYATAGTYTTTVTVHDAGGAQAAASAQATVSGPLQVRGVDADAAAGHPYSGQVAAFSDAGTSRPPSDYQAHIDWGDGASSAGTVASDPRGGFAVGGGHTYAQPGSYAITTTVSESGGDSASATSTAHVSAASAPPPFTMSDGNPKVGEHVRLDASRYATTGGGVTDIRWDLNGDGLFERDTHRATTVAVTFGQAGTHGVSVLIHHADGSLQRADGTLSVSPGTVSTINGCGAYCHVDFPPAPSQPCEIITLAEAVIQADSCWTHTRLLPGTAVTTQRHVRINGLDVYLLGGGGTIRVDPTRGTLDTSGPATVQFGEVPLAFATLHWSGLSAKQPAATPNYIPVPGAAVEGLGFAGHLMLTFFHRQVTFQADVTLPHDLGGFTANFTLVTDADHPAALDALKIDVAQADLYNLPLHALHFLYNASDDGWGGGFDIDFGSFEINADAAFHLHPSFTLDSTNAEVSGLSIALYAGIYLDALGFHYDRGDPARHRPETIGGDATLDYANIKEYGGSGDGNQGPFLISLQGGFTLTLHAPLLFTLGAELDILGEKIGTASLLWDESRSYLGGNLDVRLSPQNPPYWDDTSSRPDLSAQLHAGGFVDGTSGTFDFEGSGDFAAHINQLGCHPLGGPSDCLPTIDLGASGLVSNIGAAACVNGLAGLGYTFATKQVSVIGGSCDLGAWRPVNPHARDAAAGGQSFTLPPGLKVAAFKVVGAGGTPTVTLTGPNGERFTVGPQADYGTRAGFGMPDTAHNASLFVVFAPAGGNWTVEAAPGSAPIASVTTAQALPAPVIHARVTGSGRYRVLHYSVAALAGQTVTFLERGARSENRIGVVKVGGRGALRFTPGAGSGGARAVVAFVAENGLPRTTLVVARYRAPAPVRPGPVRSLRAARRGTRLLITWARQAGDPATAYSVLVAGPLGRRELLRVPASRRRVTVTRVLAGDRVQVTVTGVMRTRVSGPSTTVRVAPVHARHRRR